MDCPKNSITLIICDLDGNQHPATLPLPQAFFSAHGPIHWSAHAPWECIRALFGLIFTDMRQTIRPNGHEEV
jgi:hypothetical protein